MAFDTNQYGEVFNGEGTYLEIARVVHASSVMVDWIDQQGTLLNILFTIPLRVGCGGGELDARRGLLVVAVMGHGAYAFSGQVHPGYCGVKLGISGQATNERLADLINGVLDQLALHS